MNEDDFGGGFQASVDEEREGILPALDVAFPTSVSTCAGAASASASASAMAGIDERLLKVEGRLEMRVSELLKSHVICFERGAVAASAAAIVGTAADRHRRRIGGR